MAIQFNNQDKISQQIKKQVLKDNNSKDQNKSEVSDKVDRSTPVTKADLISQLSQIDVRKLPKDIEKENHSKNDWRNEPGVWDNKGYN